MKDFSKKHLVINYLLDICTPKEQEDIENWLAKSDGNIYLLQQVAKDLKQEHPFSPTEKDQIKENILSEITKESNSKSKEATVFGKAKYLKNKNRTYKSKKVFFKRAEFWIKAAAVILVIITASAGAFYYINKTMTKPAIVWQQRTLPYGQTATLRFSDGSVIKLNGGSTLRYPKKFEGNKREVYLEGEAFFSIARDEDHAFIVHAGTITTRVLGTSFNIEAYKKGKKIQVVVAEGTVAVIQENDEHIFNKSEKQIILEKNQWVTYRKSGGLVEKKEGDILEMVAWKDRVLIFNNKPFDEVVRMLERWYGVKIILEDKELENIILTGKHEDVSLKKVLESIQYASGIEYTMNGDVVTIQLPEKKSKNW